MSQRHGLRVVVRSEKSSTGGLKMKVLLLLFGSTNYPGLATFQSGKKVEEEEEENERGGESGHQQQTGIREICESKTVKFSSPRKTRGVTGGVTCVVEGS